MNIMTEINFTIGKDNIERDFPRIASEIMNQWILKVNYAEYRIAEIEFYLHSDFHEDSYSHRHVLQREKGRWYLHGSGLDITFGSDKMYASILLRAIYNLKNGDYIYGPLNSLAEIFNSFSGIYKTHQTIGLIPAKNSQFVYEKPICAPRVGLNQVKDPIMFDKHYRYLIMPKRKHAEKTKIAEALRKQGCTEDEIRNIWG